MATLDCIFTFKKGTVAGLDFFCWYRHRIVSPVSAFGVRTGSDTGPSGVMGLQALLSFCPKSQFPTDGF